MRHHQIALTVTVCGLLSALTLFLHRYDFPLAIPVKWLLYAAIATTLATSGSRTLADLERVSLRTVGAFRALVQASLVVIVVILLSVASHSLSTPLTTTRDFLMFSIVAQIPRLARVQYLEWFGPVALAICLSTIATATVPPFVWLSNGAGVVDTTISFIVAVGLIILTNTHTVNIFGR